MNILIHLVVFITFINHLSPPTVAILIAPLTILHYLYSTINTPLITIIVKMNLVLQKDRYIYSSKLTSYICKDPSVDKKYSIKFPQISVSVTKIRVFFY